MAPTLKELGLRKRGQTWNLKTSRELGKDIDGQVLQEEDQGLLVVSGHQNSRVLFHRPPPGNLILQGWAVGLWI